MTAGTPPDPAAAEGGTRALPEPAQVDLHTGMHRGAAISAALGAAVTWLNLVQRWEVYDPRWQLPVMILFSVLGLTALVVAFRRPEERWALQAYCGAAVVLSGPALLVWAPHTPVERFPPGWDALLIGAILGPIAFGRRFGLLASVCAGVTTCLLRLRIGDPGHTERPEIVQAICEGFVYFSMGCAIIAVVVLFEAAGRYVTGAARRLWSLQAEIDAGRRRRLDEARLDGLLHDTVLAALLVTGRGHDDTAGTQLARQALAAVDSLPEDVPDTGRMADVLSRFGATVGVHVRVDVQGVIADPVIASVLTGAAKEALSNVARHSGQDHAEVTG